MSVTNATINPLRFSILEVYYAQYPLEDMTSVIKKVTISLVFRTMINRYNFYLIFNTALS